MSLYYADTSALARAYLPEEEEHSALRDLLLESQNPVVTSELATLELAAAMAAAERAHRIADARAMMRQIDADMSGDPVALLALDPDTVFPVARGLVDEHPLFAANAIHLAVALVEARVVAPDGRLVLVTRDSRQATAARSEGLSVGEP